jgi:putative transposase
MPDFKYFQTLLADKLSRTNILILSDIVKCFLCLQFTSGILTLSRYSNYCDRTLGRFMGLEIAWIELNLRVIKLLIQDTIGLFLLCADETVEGKAGKKTHGIDRFYSSIQQQPIRSVCLFGFSLVSVKTGTSYPLVVEQVVKTQADKALIKAKKEEKQAGKGKKAGRKLGQKNGIKTENQTASYRTFKSCFSKITISLLSIFGELFKPIVVVDSAYGTQDYMDLVHSKGLKMISKFRNSTQLFFLPDHQAEHRPKKKRGRPLKYGKKMVINQLDSAFLVSESVEKNKKTKIFNFQALNKSIPNYLLNIVVIETTNTKTNKVGHAILFSNDLTLTDDQIVKYYQLRFQIEFDFRDAKQYFGIHKMKNYKETPMMQMFNLAFFSLTVSRILVQQYQDLYQIPNLSILDLKNIVRTRWILNSVLISSQNDPISINNSISIQQFLPKDMINPD